MSLPLSEVGSREPTFTNETRPDAVGKKPKSNPTYFALLGLALILCLGIFVLDGGELKASLAILLMLDLLVMKVPIAVSMGLPGLVGVWAISGDRAVVRSLMDIPFGTAASWSMSVLPMFILLGMILWRSGATTKVFDAARAWLGWLPGGQAITTNLAGAGLAAASGSTIGITYALGRIGIPEMLRSGYDRRLAVGSVITAGLPGQLIPPSLLLVVYAGIVNVPVGQALLAGIVPGLLVAAVSVVMIVLLAVFAKGVVPRGRDAAPAATWPDRWRTLANVIPLPALIAVVMGGMYLGFFTATEGAAFGVAGALLIAAFALKGKQFVTAVKESVVSTIAASGAVFLVLIGAGLLNRLMSLSGIANSFSETIESMGLGPTGFVLLSMVVFLILGMFIEPMSMMLLSIPILMPTLLELEINLFWFGVITVLMAELGGITPPVGVLSFVLYKLVQDRDVNQGRRISITDIFTAGVFALPVVGLVIFLLFLFPELVTFLAESSSVQG
ncbi:TRAP transporter large permease [Arthrobacter crystallopoietes]|uniref:TRAP transporter large permease n=1 Tax=Crystallibacter crystallopoietes TaxID=37928 RepID=UPI003D24B310